MNGKIIFLTVLFASLFVAGCSLLPPSVAPTSEDYLKTIPREPQSTQPTTEIPEVSLPDVTTKSMTATLVTNYGNITITFYPESPKTVDNFLKLAKGGFYDGVGFHRVIKGFMVQTGDPNSKDDDWSNDGRGGPGYAFADEFNQHPLVRGSVAMANSGPDTNGSQFFIVTAESTPWLDGKHTNFGYVSKGMEVVDKIETTRTNEQDHPLENITIERIVIEDNK